MKNLRNRREKGITLIALVVTIVVLIILATISINAVIGQGGIIEQAKRAKNVHDEGQSEELTKLEEAANGIAKYYTDGGGSTGNIDTETGWDLDKVNKVKSTDNINVPVPKGYVASTVTGETSVSTGFVIKEGTDGSKTSGINEFVWVPVSSISDIYDEANKAGQLWDFSGTTSTKRTYPTKQNSGYREPDVVTLAEEGVDSTSGSSYDAVSTNLQHAGLESSAKASNFKTQLQKEFDEMIKSVKEYGGFYIGRYETGNLSQTEAVVQKNNTDITAQTWYTMYKLCKTVKVNDNVYTGMIWGCQWDATLRWMQTSTDSSVASFPTNSEGKGNYSGTKEPIATGSNTAYAVNNIYDMAGNVAENTIEASFGTYRILRGSMCLDTTGPVSVRTSADPRSIGDREGCRLTLYIK